MVKATKDYPSSSFMLHDAQRWAEGKCGSWKRSGWISFGRLWEILSEPARNPGDLLRKAAFVRFGIPGCGFGKADVPGGTQGLLISIAISGQHEWVRLAAIAALYGFHLDVGDSATWEEGHLLDLHVKEEHPDGLRESCQGPLISRHAQENVAVLKYMLNPPNARGLDWYFVMVFRQVTNDGKEFPQYFADLSRDLAGFLVDPRTRFISGRYFAPMLAESSDPRAAEVLSIALLDSTDRDPHSLEQLLKVVSKPPRIQASLRDAVVKLKEEVKDHEAEPEFTDVFELIRKILNLTVVRPDR
jgi:hypothetical protein